MTWRSFPEPYDSITPLKQGIAKVAGRLGSPGATEIGTIFSTWNEAVGDQIANHAQPTGMKKSDLVVEIDDPKWATQLKWLSPQVIKRLNEAIGHDAISKLEIRVVPRQH